VAGRKRGLVALTEEAGSSRRSDWFREVQNVVMEENRTKK